ncbi:MAG: sulfite exporter TauE/SafE family protein [Bacteroidetes bacterium]|nr:sulfite exporter TauE/SafE family protein [Bacteroidota bacterium]
MNSELFFLLPLLFLVAVFYSSVGHGGASGYLAAMSILGMNPELMRTSALILNLFVSGISFYGFRKGGHFRWKLFFPFAVTSVPAAFTGAGFQADTLYYKIILGIVLLFASLKISGLTDNLKLNIKSGFSLITAMTAGLILGFVSGMIGIGGGIILSPILLIFGWADVKETAAVSALFIFVNSASGLARISLDGIYADIETVYMISAVIAGGMIGTYWGSYVADSRVLRYVLSAVLFAASVKLIFV